MSKLGHLIRAAFNTANSSRKSIGRPAYVGLLIATTGALLCAGGAAHSGPCTVQIAIQQEHVISKFDIISRATATSWCSVKALQQRAVHLSRARSIDLRIEKFLRTRRAQVSLGDDVGAGIQSGRDFLALRGSKRVLRLPRADEIADDD